MQIGIVQWRATVICVFDDDNTSDCDLYCSRRGDIGRVLCSYLPSADRHLLRNLYLPPPSPLGENGAHANRLADREDKYPESSASPNLVRLVINAESLSLEEEEEELQAASTHDATAAERGRWDDEGGWRVRGTC